MKILIIDDDRAYALGLAQFANEHLPDALVELIGFSDAAHAADVESFDYILVDLSHPRGLDAGADEFPGVKAAGRVSALRGARRRPFIVVLTGESGVFARATVRRRLKEAGCEYFIHRSVLADHFDRIITPTGPVTGALGSPGPIEVDGVKVGQDAALNKFVEVFPNLRIAMGRRQGQILSDELAVANRLVDAQPPQRRTKRQPGLGFVRRLWESSSRIVPKD